MPRSRVKHFSADGVEPEEGQEQWFSLRIEDLARMVQYMPKQRGNCRDGSGNPNEEVVGGWGPRYLATSEGPKFVDGGRIGRPLMSSFWNHERTWLRLTP